ncbi:MAG: HAD family phosphatase [Bifidobacteriaceae bacterium]|jgi:HAD superfamily hydrolase (TIGR01509 family)|nr:HAD family phosphatase [Bifidobacteriaceae bacterium]
MRREAALSSRWGAEAVVFDVDGLLIDSSAAWEAAFWQTAARLGGQLSASQVRRLAGLSVASAALQIAQWVGAASQFARAAKVLGDSLAAIVAAEPPTAMPGARALVGTLAGRLPLGVASNGPGDVVRAMLDRAGLLAAFDLVVTADDAASKPAPDIYRLACAGLGARTDRALALEDSAVGAAAALAAGLRTVLGGPGLAGAAADRASVAALHRLCLNAPVASCPQVCGDLEDPVIFRLLGGVARGRLCELRVHP